METVTNDNSKVLEMVYKAAEELIPKIVENVAKTMNKSSFVIRCDAGYNKDDALVVKVSGGVTLPVETQAMEGEILEGKLRLW